MQILVFFCVIAFVKSEIFISVSRDYAIIETNTSSPYVDDDVSVIYTQSYIIQMIDLSNGKTFQHSSHDPGFVACSTINTHVVCAHRV